MIVNNVEQHRMDREELLEDQYRLEKQRELDKEHELNILKTKNELALNQLQVKYKANNKLKKPIIRAITLLKLFGREVPEIFIKLLD